MSSLRHTPTDAPTSSPDDAYLDAAREAILAVGWSRTTLTDIARRAGVSRMTLYRRWPDTRTLLADLMTREWGRAVGVAVGASSPPEAPRTPEAARAGVVDGVVATVRALRENELMRRIVDVDPEVLLPYLLRRRGCSQELLARALADLLVDAQARGAVRPGDPVTMARSLLLVCQGFTLSAHTMTGPAAAHDDEPAAAGGGPGDPAALDAELARLVDGFLAP